MSALIADNIHKAFGDHEVLKGVSLSVARGEVVTLIGASGSGKSTFLRCLNLLEMPQQGELAIGTHKFAFGKGIRAAGDAQLALLRRSVGMVFQHFNLFPHMSVLANVTEGPVQVKGMAQAEANALGNAICSPRSASPTRPTPFRAACPAARSSASRSRVRSR
ncbi:ABC-type histidine transport system ATPase subunit [Bradyrhizobium japonicum]|nr:ABC-type histidine transport system ATPase subunit [Bradyrhizobium japonicum]MCP1785624.1 ABC-type histidine transport system ATPase subunit [Bradyrhizobium japonicum]MCP1807503.1 ABC-type histidine transport system ATPase subunit [Bradyrhizobium japonicum]MCP1816430.1 ABC-type histidine transport system ATPase subunit [Bradyrhizobium japonicum]MCP1872057.1 ABC-type histidine transport system ATPase subunit [Bradyrhizobium japonicum]